MHVRSTACVYVVDVLKIANILQFIKRLRNANGMSFQAGWCVACLASQPAVVPVQTRMLVFLCEESPLVFLLNGNS